jgi:hypothetical protein
MKCPKRGYTSFPYLESCRKCGHALAEQRAALGLYALRPDPPDLLLAFEAARADIIGATRTPPVSAPIDLGCLEEIDLDLEEAGPATPGPYEGGGQAAAAPDSMPTLMGGTLQRKNSHRRSQVPNSRAHKRPSCRKPWT